MSEGGVTTSTFFGGKDIPACDPNCFVWLFWGPKESFDCSQPLRELVERLQRCGFFRDFSETSRVSCSWGVFWDLLKKTQAETGALLFQWWVKSRCLVYGMVAVVSLVLRNKFVGYKIQILWLKISSGSNSEWYLGALWWQRYQGQWKMTGGILQTQKTAQTCNT